MAEGGTGLPTDAAGIQQAGLFDGTGFYHWRRDTDTLGAVVALASRKASTTATIASSGTTSGAVDFRGFSRGIVTLPATFTGTVLSFTVASTSGGTYSALYDEFGVQVTVAVAQGNAFGLPQYVTDSMFVKIVSNATEGASRAISIMMAS